MPKAKKTVSSSFMNASPLKTGATLLLVFSVLVNLGTLLFYVLMHHTAQFDNDLYSYTKTKICTTDYADLSTTDQATYATFCK